MPRGEMIKTPKGMWMKMNGKWMAMPAQAAKAMQSPIDEGLASGLKNVTNLACLGPQDFDGKTLTGFEFDTSRTIAGKPSSAHVKLLADPANSLPAVVMVKSKNSAVTQRITHDPAIKIVPPM
jgi:hypothetical protein